MRKYNYSPESERGNSAVAEMPVRKPDIEPTPKAEAKIANKLPRDEQLNKFEKELEARDPGNQPA